MPARVAFEETLLDACRPAHQGQHLDPARNGDHARVEGGVVGDVGGVCVHVRSRACWSGFSRELLPRLLPLRRQGEVGRGWCRFAAMPTAPLPRSEEHTSELQSLMRSSYAVFCLKKNKIKYDNDD